MRSLRYCGVCLLALLLFLCAPRSAGADWVSGGVLVSTGSGNRDPKITTDEARGAIIAWCDVTRTYVQRVGFTGDCRWAAGGVLLSPTGIDPQIVPDGAGGAVIAWRDTRSGDSDIYAQKVDSSGTFLWMSGGVPICTAEGDQESFRMTGDGYGGAIITWEDRRDEDVHIYAQKVETGGNLLWAGDGVRVDTGLESVYAPDIDSDDNGGAYITWATLDSATTELLDRNIYLTRIDQDGSHAWNPPVGTCVSGPCSVGWPSIECWFPRLTRDGSGGAIVAWSDPRCDEASFAFCIVYAQKVNAAGAVCWQENGAQVGGFYTEDIQLGPDGLGGAFITWRDMNNIWLIPGLLAQRIDGEGANVWDSAVKVSAAYRAPGSSAVSASDYYMNVGEAGRLYVAFERELYLDEDLLWRTDIFANRLDREGLIWTSSGLPVCMVGGDQSDPRITSAGDGSSITVWEDPRDSGSIYAQLLNAWGEPPIATLLESCSFEFDGEGVVLEWVLSKAGDAMRFFVLRAEGDGGAFEEIPDPVIERNGMTFAFTDGTCEPGTVYRYRVEVEDETARRLLFESDPVTIPSMQLMLHQNYPNPFNPITTIRYYLPEPGLVVLEIYDAAGRDIVELVNEYQAKGPHEVYWDGRNANGDFAVSGVYFSRLKAGKKAASGKIVMIR
jgi:hypothetical protein